jgi:hypothetical protein
MRMEEVYSATDGKDGGGRLTTPYMTAWELARKLGIVLPVVIISLVEVEVAELGLGLDESVGDCVGVLEDGDVLAVDGSDRDVEEVFADCEELP